MIPTPQSIQLAHQRISGYIHRTPVLTSSYLNKLTGAELFFKCENLQKVGAFKARGGLNAVLRLSAEELRNGVCTHSSGNHAQAIAYAAAAVGTKAYIVMPRNAPAVKVAAVKEYGAEVIFCEPGQAAREQKVGDVAGKTGAVFIHPYNHYHVIEGQATAALELLEDVSGITSVLTPVGGGGLLSGTCLAAAAWPGVKVFAAEPEEVNDAALSLQQGKIVPATGKKTIADGLQTSLGPLTYPIIRDHVQEILLVTEDEIQKAMELVWERMKIIIEPSSAVPVAAVIKNREKFRGQRTGIILTGGNVDFRNLPFGEDQR